MTTVEYWNSTHSGLSRMRVPSSLIASSRDLKRLLRGRIPRNAKVMEIGFAPGKMLSYVAKELGGVVAGIDYSPAGIAAARELFSALDIDADVRCEDVCSSSFVDDSFDVVYSIGVIEHFENPREIVRRHVRLLRPGGRALIIIPNYGGIYGRLQRVFDPENLAIHNLDIMSCEALADLAPRDLVQYESCYETGSVNPWLVSLHKKWPAVLARAVNFSINGIALLQWAPLPGLSSMIILELVRKGDGVRNGEGGTRER